MINPRLKRIYNRMKDRCCNPNADNYKYYGGKGVTVCDEWKNSLDAFVEWALSHGYRDDLTIDRIDTNGNYSPENCRWSSHREQCNNRTTNRMITYRGVTKSLADFAREYHIPYHTLFERVVTYNWDLELALTTPLYTITSAKPITWNGETKTIGEWSEQVGIKYHTIMSRLYRGWSVDEALSIPLVRTRENKQEQK